jgi:hypothetical protein
MRFKFKTLGLALVAIVALSAVAASSASAVNFKSEKTTTFLTGDVGAQNIFTVWGGTVKCNNVTVKNGTDFSGTIGAEGDKTETASIEAEPVYSNCTAFGQNSTIDTNGCKYKFTASTTAVGNASIVCPELKEIIITVGDPGVICTVKVKGHTPSTSTVDYASGVAKVVHPPVKTGEVTDPSVTTEKSDITVTSTVGGITYTSSGGICGTSGPVAGYTGGTYAGSFTVKGYSDAAHTTLTGISIV